MTGIVSICAAVLAVSPSELRAQCTAGFGTRTGYTGDLGYPSGVSAADFNADGVPDLAVAAGDLKVLLANGDGTFQTAAVYGSLSSNWDSVAVGDFNGDGKPDAAVAWSSDSAGAVTVFLNSGSGTLLTPNVYTAAPYPRSIAV